MTGSVFLVCTSQQQIQTEEPMMKQIPTISICNGTNGSCTWGLGLGENSSNENSSRV